MSSVYPGGLDSLSTSHADGVGEKIHAADVNNIADAVNKIERELGVDPKGSYADVAARLNSGSLSVLSGATKVTLDPVTGDIVFTTNSIERGRIAEDGTFTGFAAQANVPTIQELLASTYWPTSVTTTTSLGVFTLPFAADIKAASVVLMNGAIAADDTNYWTVELMKWRNTDGVATTMATKTTQATGGQAFVQRADWNFDAIAFSGNTALLKGYSVGFRFTPTGAPSAVAGALMTVRYEPN